MGPLFVDGEWMRCQRNDGELIMKCLSMRLKEDRFGWENNMAGIFEYILGPKHVMEWSSVLDLAKDDLCFGMDRSA